MEWALLVVGIVGAVGAIAAAVFTFPTWKDGLRRPALKISAHGSPGFSQGNGMVDVTPTLLLKNEGSAGARQWELSLTPAPPRPGSRATPQGRGREWFVGDSFGWRAVDEADLLAPDSHHTFTFSTPQFTRGETVQYEFRLSASKMPTRTGAVVVTWPDDGTEPRPSVEVRRHGPGSV